MSSHCYNRDWTINDEIPEDLLNDIAGCVKMNMKIQPGCFAVMGHADQINYWCFNTFLNKTDHEKRVEAIKAESQGAPNPERFEQICMYVLEQVEKE